MKADGQSLDNRIDRKLSCNGLADATGGVAFWCVYLICHIFANMPKSLMRVIYHDRFKEDEHGVNNGWFIAGFYT